MKPQRLQRLTLLIAFLVPWFAGMAAFGGAPPSASASDSMGVLAVADAPAPAPAAEPSPAAAPADDGDFMTRMESWASNPAVRIGSRILLAILLFIGGWIVARLASYAVFHLFSRTELDNKVAQKLGLSMIMGDRKSSEDPGSLERVIAKVVYYLVMLLVVVGVLQFAGLTQVASPIAGLVDSVVGAVPSIGKAGLILVIAYFAATILRKVISGALDSAGLDRRFAELTEGDEGPQARFSETAGKVVFGLVLFFGIAGAFEALDIPPISEPLHNAVNHIIGILPRLGVAVILVGIGYFGGRIARHLVRNVLSGLGFDKLAGKVGIDKLAGKTTPSDIVGTGLMVFIIVQATIAALNELGLETLSVPLTGMMGQFWNLLPALAVSVVIVAVAVFVGQLLRKVVAGALRNLGLDSFMEKLGFKKLSEREDKLGEYSELIGFGVQAGILLLGVAQALDNLQLDTWAAYVNAFLAYIVKNVAVATFVVGVGFAIGNYVRDLIQARGEDEASRWMGEFARYAVLVFAFTMAVRQLDVAEDFVLMTFGLLFGALCLGAALAFGLGGKEVAGDIVKRRYDVARSQMNKKAAPAATKPPAPKPPIVPPVA